MHQVDEPKQPENMVSLTAILNVMFKGWWVVALFSVLGFLYSLHYTKNMEVRYTASITIGRVEAQNNTVSQKTGLESIIGIKLGGSSDSYDKYKSLLHSVALAERLQRKYGIMQFIYKNSWDKKNKKWKEYKATSLKRKIMSSIYNYLEVPFWSPPTINSFARFLTSKIDVIENRRLAFDKIEFEYKDKEFAQKFLIMIHNEVDNMLREDKLIKSTERIKYLENRLASVKVVDHRQTLIALLSTEEQNRMLLKSGKYYSAEIIDGPVISDLPTSPRVKLFLFIGAFGGIMAGTVLIYLIHIIKILAPDLCVLSFLADKAGKIKKKN